MSYADKDLRHFAFRHHSGDYVGVTAWEGQDFYKRNHLDPREWVVMASHHDRTLLRLAIIRFKCSTAGYD